MRFPLGAVATFSGTAHPVLRVQAEALDDPGRGRTPRRAPPSFRRRRESAHRVSLPLLQRLACRSAIELEAEGRRLAPMN
jgi:hypothetical protein